MNKKDGEAMFLDVLRGIFVLANTFIALFIVVYAFLFLKKTKSHKERRPWDYLFIASIIYLAYNLLTMLLTIYKMDVLLSINILELNIFFQFLYTGLILLAFISQTDLIFKNEIIIITRKLEPNERIKLDKDIQKDIEKDLKLNPGDEKSKKDKV